MLHFGDCWWEQQEVKRCINKQRKAIVQTEAEIPRESDLPREVC